MATTKRAMKAKPAKRVDLRKTTSTRITPETRGKIEEAAAQSGRSLAQEIEFRLEQSFRGTGFEALGLGDPNNIGFLRLMGIMFTNICHPLNAESVWTNPQAFVEAEAGFREFFKAVRKLSPDLVKDVEAYDEKTGLGKSMGKGMADMFVKTLKVPGTEELLRRAENLQRNGAATRSRQPGRAGRKADKGRKS